MEEEGRRRPASSSRPSPGAVTAHGAKMPHLPPASSRLAREPAPMHCLAFFSPRYLPLPTCCLKTQRGCGKQLDHHRAPSAAIPLQGQGTAGIRGDFLPSFPHTCRWILGCFSIQDEVLK